MTAWNQEQDLVILPADPIHRYYEESGILYDVASVTYDYAVFDVDSNSNLLWSNQSEAEVAWVD